MRRIFIFLLLVKLLTSCNYGAALIMAIPEKRPLETWKDKPYKVLVQRRQGWAGPPYVRLKVKRRILGVYCFRVVKETISYYQYQRGKTTVAYRNDSLVIDFSHKEVIRHSNP